MEELEAEKEIKNKEKGKFQNSEKVIS